MLSRYRLLWPAVGLAAVLSSLALWASKDFVPPRAGNANTYASKDAHPKEKVTAAIDLYNIAPKDQIFSAPYNQQGILPVLLIITNDGDQPISVKSMRAELVTAGRDKLEALDTDDVFRRVAHINGSSTPERVGPITIGGTKNKKAQKEYQEITSARFAAEAIEPHTTKSGFLFFDIEGIKQPVAGAHLYLTGIDDAGGNELLYFEIPVIPSNAAGE
ncbi:MAG TPA: hypothetical protein VLV47_01200 [Candidatus Bathyarchaeia archaeon]|nr:hypothetical protein [Candidatus Bathyarchaeia archaeon]